MTWLYDFWFILVALLFLGLSIFVHELGHFLAARRRGLVVKRFSIGFGPRIFGWERNGVEYRLSAFPFGGYVALPQLVDMGRIEGGEEEEDDEEGEEEKEELPEISYSDKMIVSVMGAVFNVLLALSLASVLWFFGHDVYSSELTTEVGYVAKEIQVMDSAGKATTVPGPAYAAGVLPGDKILQVDGSGVRDFLDVQQHVTAGSGLTADGLRVTRLLVERDGKQLEIEVFPGIVSSEQMRMIGIGPKEIFFVGALRKGMPAIQAGMEEGDQLWAVDDQVLHSFRALQDYVQENGDRVIAVSVKKGGEDGPIEIYEVQPVEDTIDTANGPVTMKLIGFERKLKSVTTYPNPFIMIFNRMNDMYLTLTSLVNPKSDVKMRNMSGPVGIVNHLSLFAKIGFKKLLWFVVFINVNLAILNVLPIPVLDGGHMMFATIEKLSGKPIPLAILERTQVLFVVLIFSFMLYVTFFDVRRIFPS